MTESDNALNTNNLNASKLDDSNLDENSMNNNHSLLNEADFARLMEAEFIASKKADDEVSKQRSWKAIQANIDNKSDNTNDTSATGNIVKNKKINFFKNYYSIAATLLVAAVTLPIMFIETNSTSVENGFERTKGNKEIINTNLTVYTLDKTGKLIHSNGQHKVGSTLLFKVHSSGNGVASIITSKNGTLSNNGFVYDITRDKLGQLLSRQEQAYGYMIEPTDKILQFCVIATYNKTTLHTTLTTLNDTWARLDSSACTTINVTDSLD